MGGRNWKINDIPCLVFETSNRTILTKPPAGYPWRYAARHSDTNFGLPATLEERVVVNYWGLVFASQPIDDGIRIIEAEDRTIIFDINDNFFREQEFRVWPNGTVQPVEDGAPHSHMSDDFVVVMAYDEEEALLVAEGGLN